MIPKFHFISIFPEMISDYMSKSLFKRALERNLLQYEIWNPRNFTEDCHQTVDDRPFGGGEGMVMKPEPLAKCLEQLFAQSTKPKKPRVLHFSPQGKVLTQRMAERLMRESDEFVFLSSRYSGVDQRFLNEFVDEEVSLGDYVLAGGELPSLVLCETMSRLIPGFLGDDLSSKSDSFSLPGLESPLFTQPRDWNGRQVPAVLLSGHHGKIEQWKKWVEVLITEKKRPDLLKNYPNELVIAAKKYQETLSEEELEQLGLIREGIENE